MILKFFTAIYMKMGNTLFKKVTLHLVAYESGQLKTKMFVRCKSLASS